MRTRVADPSRLWARRLVVPKPPSAYLESPRAENPFVQASVISVIIEITE